MKKVLLVVLASLLGATLLLTGCGKKVDSNDIKGASKATKSVKVGFIYIDEVGGAGFTYSHDQGRKEIEKELGVETVFREKVPEGPEVEQVIKEMIEKDKVNVIFATSFGYMDYVKKMAAIYPNVKFFHCSGSNLGTNLANYFGRIEQARYLTGIVAGLKTQTNHIGYVAAFEIPEVVRGINAFTLGVRSANPNAKVYVKWTNTWTDAQLAKNAANELLNQGADIIAQHQDSYTPQQAAEEKGKWSIGYHSDMSKMAPKAVLTSAIWNWGPYYVEQVKEIMNGTWKAKAYMGDMKDGTVEIAPLAADTPQVVRDKINHLVPKIKDGSFNVFSGPIYNNLGKLKVQEGSVVNDEELAAMDWFVQGVEIVK